MNRLFYFISFKWIENLKISYKKRKNIKKTKELDKKWDMKLRGIK